MEAPSLTFTSFDTTEIGSIAHHFAGSTPDQLCGIYILRFETDEFYAGQSVNVITRFAKHRRTWGDIVSLEFATCAREDLDECERRVVSQEEKAHSPRNLLLTNHPGGWDDIEIEQEAGGVSIRLPMDRSDRTTIASEPVNSPLARYWRLAGRPDYSKIRQQLGIFIGEAIPDPVLTTHGMWAITAYPSTGQTKQWQRMVAISCGRVESLVIGEETLDNGRKQIVANVNLSSEIGREALRALPLRWEKTTFIRDHTYSAAEVIPLQAIGLKALKALLAQPAVLDSVYNFNVRQMRQGSRLFAKFHNTALAYDALTATHQRG